KTREAAVSCTRLSRLLSFFSPGPALPMKRGMSYEGAVARVASIEAQLGALTGARPTPAPASATAATSASTTGAAAGAAPTALSVTSPVTAPTSFQSVLAGAQRPATAGY